MRSVQREFLWPHTIVFVSALLSSVYVRPLHAEDTRIARGRDLAHDYAKGNCLACHRIPGDSKAVTLATIGPPLVQMRERFPDHAALRKQIWDSTARNPLTLMPPFGKHKVLTEEEIDLIVDYVYQY